MRVDYSPFFRNHWSQRQPLGRQYSQTPSAGGIPVHSAEPPRPAHPIQHPPVNTSARKAVEIPVHFVGSDSSRSASAVKIQKVFRGFLVRKSVKKIKDVKAQVDEIEERLSKTEVVELIRRDEKERLKMNEGLMSLLFKLDSVKGIDLGVRNLRKAVIRKAILLQEKIDAAASPNSGDVVEINEVDNETLETMDCGETNDLETIGENCADVSEDTDWEILGKSDNFVCPTAENHFEELGNSIEDSDYSTIPTDRSIELDDSAENNSAKFGNPTEISADSSTPTDHSASENSVHLEDVNCEHSVETGDKAVDREMLKVDEENCNDGQVTAEGKGKEGGSRDEDLLKKMMEENAKMMDMMTQLTEKNEQQTKMLNALTHRVELLEKAFVCDVIRRKKKKKAKNSAGKLKQEEQS